MVVFERIFSGWFSERFLLKLEVFSSGVQVFGIQGWTGERKGGR